MTDPKSRTQVIAEIHALLEHRDDDPMLRWLAWTETEYQLTPINLAVARVIIAAYFLVLVVPQFQWMALFPEVFLDPPPGLTQLVPVIPPAWVFVLLEAVFIVATVFFGAGRRTTLAAWAMAVTLLAGNMWAYSFGKINHNFLLITVAPLCIAAADKRPLRAWPLAVLAWITSVAMFTAGWQKAVTGWLDLSNSAVLGYVLTTALRSDPNGPVMHLTGIVPVRAWELADQATVWLELGFVLAVVRLRSFRLICAVATVFHLSVGLLMRIFFVQNLLTYAVFVDWSPVTARLPVGQWSVPRDGYLLAGGLALAAVTLTWGNPWSTIFGTVPGGPALWIIGFASLFCVWYLAVSIRAWVRAAREEAQR